MQQGSQVQAGAESGAESGAKPAGRSGRDWAVDSLFFVGSVIAGLTLFLTNPDVETAPDLLLLADLVAGSALCVALWWRRRWPVQLGVLGALVGTFSGMSGGAGLVLLFTVAVHRRGPVLWAMAAFGVLTAAPYELLRGQGDDVSFRVGIAFAVLLIGSVVAWGMFVGARRQLLASLRERALRAETEQQLRVEQARQTARHNERTRIAREMHDVLAHRISLVSLHAGALEFRADAPAEDVAKSAAVIRQSAHQALQDLREILGVLRVSPGEDAGEDAGDDADGAGRRPEAPMPTLADVPRLIEESRQAGMEVRCVTAVEDVGAVPSSIGRTAFRVVQEGLTNVRKHAAGATAVVNLSGGPGTGLSVEVCDTGACSRELGREPQRLGREPGRASAAAIPGAGQGLTGLAERAEVVGGRLEHGRSGPEGSGGPGWRLRAWLPWPA